MEIKHKDDSEKGMFYVEQDGSIIAKMTYAWSGIDRIIIEHTVVSELLKGHGLGKQLVSKAVDFAREKGITIVPVCSFAKSVFDKVDEFKDVL